MEVNICGEGWARSHPLRRSHHAFLARIWVLGGLRSLCSRKALSKTFSDINRPSVFLGQSSKAIEIKINKWELVKLTSFCTTKETTKKKKRKKTAYRMGENICQWCNRKGLNFQNTLTAHTINNKKQTAQLKTEQNTLTDISPKKTYKWPIGA